MDDARQAAEAKGEVFDPNRGFAFALTMGTANALINKIKVDKLLGPWLRAGGATGIRAVATRIYRAAFVNGAIAVGQGALNDLAANVFGVGQRKVFDPEKRGMEFGVGAATGAVFAGVPEFRQRSEGQAGKATAGVDLPMTEQGADGQQEVLVSRGEEASSRVREGSGSSHSDVRGEAERLVRQYKLEDRVELHDNINAISAPEDTGVKIDAIRNPNMLAGFDPNTGKIHVLLDRIGNKGDVEQIIRHEGMHLAFRGVAREEYKQILASARRMAGEDPQFKKIQSLYRDKGPDEQVEEYLAMLVEHDPKSPILSQIVYQMKMVLAKTFGAEMKFSDEETKAFLSDTRKKVEVGRASQGFVADSGLSLRAQDKNANAESNNPHFEEPNSDHAEDTSRAPIANDKNADDSNVGHVAVDINREKDLFLRAGVNVAFERMSHAGRAVTKHPKYFGFTNADELRKIYNTPEKLNALGELFVKTVLSSGTRTSGFTKRYSRGWVTYTLPDGRAASWHSDGDFIGFRGKKYEN